MARKTTQSFVPLQMTLFLFLIFVRGNEDADDAFKNRRNLVLEYFLPINSPVAVNVPLRREKRDLEGSGEDDSVFSELQKSVEEADNLTQNAFTKVILQEDREKFASDLAMTEGSGEIEEVNEGSEKEKSDVTLVPLISETEVFTNAQSDEVIKTTMNSKITENRSESLTEVTLSSTETVFDKFEDSDGISSVRTEETTIVATEPISTVILINTTMYNKKEPETTNLPEEITTEPIESKLNELTTTSDEFTVNFQTTGIAEEPTTTLSSEATIFISQESLLENLQTTYKTEETTLPPATTTFISQEGSLEDQQTTYKTEKTTSPLTTLLAEEIATTSPFQSSTLIPILIPQKNLSEEHAIPVTDHITTPQPTEEITKAPTSVPITSKFLTSPIAPKPTESHLIPSKPPTTSEPIIEEIFKETKIDKKLEALPGNILQKENLSLAADPLLIANTRLMDSEENVKLSSSEPKRLGAYIVIGLILLSFLSLVGYITFKKRMSRKRQEFESNQESNDTEKALLSLSDYKDNSELEENHLKNNEITPIVVKSNSQINKFEKNTNFSSPKNLNTIANEKNIEKDNVLKSTAENLTQVIIEDSPKDMEEDKKVPSMEKLIVKTRIDQDSIPKKPIIINRSSTGYLPIPQDNS